MIIRAENPRIFTSQVEAMSAQLSQVEANILARHRDASTVLCASCGSLSAVETSRLRGDGQVLCSNCLPAYEFCQSSHRYHPAESVEVYHDGSTMQAGMRPLQICKAASGLRHALFTCAHCEGKFYGSGVVIRDGANRKTVCRHCAESVGHRCESCNTYFASAALADDCCGDRQHYEYKEPVLTVQEGTNFTRFSQRPVGLEIETGKGGRKIKLLKWLKANLPTWGMTSDGSLCDGAYEYVSSPMSGNLIEESYKGFAQAMLDRDVAVEQQRAGYHVHVNAQDIYQHIRGLQEHGKDAQADMCEDMMQQWGQAMVSFSRSLVAPWRRESHFCIGEFGYRSSKGSYPRYLKKARGASYPPVAIREKTLEFRIFPSTANIDWHLGRVEFAQKSVDVLYAAMQDAEKASSLGRLLLALNGLEGDSKVKYLCLELGMSEEGSKALLKMHKTWTPGEYADGKAVESGYKREPKPRKPRTRRALAA